MGDFLSSMIARTQGTAPILMPRHPSTFEPIRFGGELGEGVPRQVLLSNDTDPISFDVADALSARGTENRREGVESSSTDQDRISRAGSPQHGSRFQRRIVDVSPNEEPEKIRSLDAVTHDDGTSDPRQPSAVPADKIRELARGASLRPSHRARVSIAAAPSQDSDPTGSSPVGNVASWAQPTVHVTIGRIEVKAMRDSGPPQKRTAGTPAGRLSLDDYLRQRENGKR